MAQILRKRFSHFVETLAHVTTIEPRTWEIGDTQRIYKMSFSQFFNVFFYYFTYTSVIVKKITGTVLNGSI